MLNVAGSVSCLCVAFFISISSEEVSNPTDIRFWLMIAALFAGYFFIHKYLVEHDLI